MKLHLLGSAAGKPVKVDEMTSEFESPLPQETLRSPDFPDENILSVSEIEQLETQAAEEISAAVAFARAGTHPAPESHAEYTYA